MITIPQRHRQTDRQTTCLGSTPLRVASRGKNSVNPNIFNALKLCIQQCAWRSLWRSYNKLENHTLSANLCQSAILTFNYVTIRFSTCHFLLVVHWNRVSISINFFSRYLHSSTSETRPWAFNHLIPQVPFLSALNHNRRFWDIRPNRH